MKTKYVLLVLALYAFFEWTKPEYPVEINKTQCIIIAIGVAVIGFLIMYAVLSIILYFNERGK